MTTETAEAVPASTRIAKPIPQLGLIGFGLLATFVPAISIGQVAVTAFAFGCWSKCHGKLAWYGYTGLVLAWIGLARIVVLGAVALIAKLG